MSDYLIKLANHPATRGLIKSIGLPTPLPLARAEGAYVAQPLAGKAVLFGAAAGGYATGPLDALLKGLGAEVTRNDSPGEQDAGRYDALVFDATGIADADQLKALYRFFHPVMTRVNANGRVLIVGRLPEVQKTPVATAAARALEGFMRSVGKEVGKRGATANLLYCAEDAVGRVQGPATFFLSNHSTYVDGQPVRVTATAAGADAVPVTGVLKGKVALVTGGARGIGAATARRLAAEGAHVVCLDIPADQATLEETVKGIDGTALPLDITDPAAPQAIASFLKEKFGGVDIVVHNAGITRDKTLARMAEHYWDMVLNINLAAILRIDQALLGGGVVRQHGRIVCLSSIGGIAGNMGQTNYGATKAGLIGYVAAQAKAVAAQGICVNAVAPGFIETRMTAAMPFMIREAGRRMNSLSQGGQPEDVAELICFLSSPGAGGVTGNTIRVCGQSLIGA